MKALAIALSIAWTLLGLIWTWRAERRLRRLEAAERERNEAENSTIIRRPRRSA